MNQEQISKLEMSIKNMDDKKSRIYFIVQETLGNAKASVSYIYHFAMSLLNSGYNPIMLHEKPDYSGVANWLGQEYMDELPHKAIEGQNLEVSPDDFIIVPELYGFVMPQVSFTLLLQAYQGCIETTERVPVCSQL